MDTNKRAGHKAVWRAFFRGMGSVGVIWAKKPGKRELSEAQKRALNSNWATAWDDVGRAWGEVGAAFAAAGDNLRAAMKEMDKEIATDGRQQQ